MGGRIDKGMPRMANERLAERSIFIAMTMPRMTNERPLERSVFIAIASPGWRRHNEL